MPAQDNVTSLHREAGAETGAPAAQADSSLAAEAIDLDLDPLPVSADEMAQATASAGEFTSPFEDELDTPAFLRRAQD